MFDDYSMSQMAKTYTFMNYWHLLIHLQPFLLHCYEMKMTHVVSSKQTSLVFIIKVFKQVWGHPIETYKNNTYLFSIEQKYFASL